MVHFATVVAQRTIVFKYRMSTRLDKLNSEQKELFDKIVYKKRNIFFTGCAGTGKSFVLQCIVDELRSRNSNPGTVAVTASTGKAAFGIGGTTLHSFAGIQLGKGTKEEVSSRVVFNKNAAERWKEVNVLIIDEVSMIDGELFDKIEYVARQVRRNTNKFGGIQLILVGDLLQLPPVDEHTHIKKRVVEAESWKTCVDEYILLKHVFRQQDINFVRVLTCIRIGAITEEVTEFMKKLAEEKDFGGESGPVDLYATRNKTEKHNKLKLDAIDSDSKTYKAKDVYPRSARSNSRLLDSCQALPFLELKIGAQVMLIKNINKDLVNGTVGTVTNFTSTVQGKESTTNTDFNMESIPIVRFDLINGKTFTRPMKRELWESVSSTGQLLASRRQVPLILAWAVTIHKSQGQTIQKVRADVSEVFESGQLYTALSRAVSADALQVIGFDPDRVKVDQVSLKFCLDNDLI